MSSGSSVYDLTKGLNGTAGLTSRNGAIAGFNVEQLLKRIERRPLSGGGEFRTGKTPYETLTVNLKIIKAWPISRRFAWTGRVSGSR